MSKKIIAVIGATGAQGGGLARAILADKSSEYSVRAITRKVDSDNAKALAALGAEVVSADLDDKATLVTAFKGAHGAFCVTNYWEHFSPEKEIAQAKNLAEAAKAAGVEHTIWSTLEDTRKLVALSDNRMPTLKDKYKVPHFDTKGESDAFFRDAGNAVTFLLTSFYWENFIFFGMGPKKGPDGKLAITLNMGDRKLPGIGVEDIGRCAYGIFKKGAALAGKYVGISGEHITGADMAAAFTHALERPVGYNAVPNDMFRAFPFPGADDLGNMFQYKHDFNSEYCAARDVAAAKALNPELQNFAAWLQRNKSRIPLE